MATRVLIKNAKIVNENRIYESDVLIEDDLIVKIDGSISDSTAKVIDASGRILLPGVIDDQVHFREPGLTHKGNIASESRAAVAGGITTFMEQPNSIPQTKVGGEVRTCSGNFLCQLFIFVRWNQ